MELAQTMIDFFNRARFDKTLEDAATTMHRNDTGEV